MPDRPKPTRPPSGPQAPSGAEEGEFLRRVLGSSVVAVLVLDRYGRAVYANGQAAAEVGVDPAGGVPPEIAAFRWLAVTGKALHDVRCALPAEEGKARVLSINAEPLAEGAEPAPQQVVLSVNDITEQYSYYEQALRESEQRLEEAQQIARLGHWFAYQDRASGRQRLWWSPVIYDIFGRDPQRFVPTFRRYLRAIHPDDRPMLRARLASASQEGAYEVEHRIVRPDGEVRWIRERGKLEHDASGRRRRMFGTVQDITEQKELQRELERRASHDPLTELYNRAKLQQLLHSAQAAYRRHGTPFAVVLFDVDHFKAVNDRWGHTAGDAVLWELARRIAAVLRETDDLGRWGGEEFLALASYTDEAGGAELAARIRRSVAERPIGHVGTVTVSLGVAAIEPGLSLETLEHRADQALYAAKAAGRNQVCRYTQLQPPADGDG